MDKPIECGTGVCLGFSSLWLVVQDICTQQQIKGRRQSCNWHSRESCWFLVTDRPDSWGVVFVILHRPQMLGVDLLKTVHKECFLLTVGQIIIVFIYYSEESIMIKSFWKCLFTTLETQMILLLYKMDPRAEIGKCKLAVQPVYLRSVMWGCVVARSELILNHCVMNFTYVLPL